MALLLTITQATIDVTVLIGLGGENVFKTTLDEAHVTTIGEGPGYKRGLFTSIIKDRLINARQDCEYSKPFELPAELHNNTTVTVSWFKEQKYCIVCRSSSATIKQFYFAPTNLSHIIQCDAELPYELHYLSDLSERNFQILSFNKSNIREGFGEEMKYMTISPITNLILNEQSVTFFHRIRGMFHQHPSLTLNNCTKLLN